MLQQNRTFADLWPPGSEMAEWVHPHWRGFSLPIAGVNHCIGIYMALVGILGVIGNATILLLFSISSKLRIPSHLLIVNLAAVEMLFNSLTALASKMQAAFNQRWMWSKQGNYRMEGFHTSCTFDYLTTDTRTLLFCWAMYIFGFFVPLVGIVFCYSSIVRQVSRTRRRLQTYDTPRGRMLCCTRDDQMGTIQDQTNSVYRDSQYKREMHVTKTSAILVMLYLLFWGPYAMVCLVALLGGRAFLTPAISELPGLLAKSSAIVNPFVYAFTYRDFRVELFRIVTQIRRCIYK